MSWPWWLSALMAVTVMTGCGKAVSQDDRQPSESWAGDAAPELSVEGLEFVTIPAGTFVMGTDRPVVPLVFAEAEMPAHRVRLERPFFISRTEVTVGQFRRFVRDTGYRTDAEASGQGGRSLDVRTGMVQHLPRTTWKSPGFHQTEQHPVVCVSWRDAVQFCHWMSDRHGRTFRLPTEAEWEYACRAGTTTTFCTGDRPESIQGFANVADQTFRGRCPTANGAAGWTDGFVFTAPVGRFRPNAWGLYDMHGNVGEWCLDWFAPDFYDGSPQDSPVGPEQPTEWHVVRGGSWYNAPASCRSSGRHDGIPTAVSTTNGFRVVAESMAGR